MRCAHKTEKYEVVGSPVGDFELLFCHVISPEDQECGDLILTTAKSAIYPTKPLKRDPNVHLIMKFINIHIFQKDNYFISDQ